MGNYNSPKYRKEIRPYAEVCALFSRASSREDFIRSNKLAEVMLKGKWLSLHTEARTVYLTRKDGSPLRVLVVTRNDHRSHNCTGLLWLHGGGYAMGLPETDVPFANLFTEDDTCVMVLPDYRLSVEAPYPAALDDAYQCLLWMKENAEKLGIRPDQLFVGGESAGGGLACALTIFARDRQEVNIAFQMPLYPMIDDRPTETSADNQSPVWDTKKNQAAWNIYRGTEETTSPYFAPARSTDFENLPPAFTIVSDNEPFYAETKTYFHHLYQAGVEIMIKIYPGCFHSFDVSCPNTESSRRARKLEQNAFRYAQKNFTAAQLSTADDQEGKEEAAIADMIQDIETQHDFLAEANQETEETTAEEIETAKIPAEEQTEEPIETETAEETDIETEQPAEENSDAEQSEEAAEIPAEEPGTPAEVTEIASSKEESAEEAAEIPVEETETPMEEEAPAESADEPAEEEAAPADKDVEERPVSTAAVVSFPDHPDEKKEEVITEEEIDEISRKLTDISIVPAFRPSPKPEPVMAASPIKHDVPEAEKTVSGPFTREDVIKILKEKEEPKMEEGSISEEETAAVEEDQDKTQELVLDKIIAEDTNISLDEIDHLAAKL